MKTIYDEISEANRFLFASLDTTAGLDRIPAHDPRFNVWWWAYEGERIVHNSTRIVALAARVRADLAGATS